MRHVSGSEVARFVCEILGREQTFGRAFNLCQDETPSLGEFVALLAGLLGAPARTRSVSAEAIRAAGLEPRGVSPFSVQWMSYIDPSLAKAELGFRHEPLETYLASIVASFLAHPPAEPPPSYARRAEELALAGAPEAG